MTTLSKTLEAFGRKKVSRDTALRALCEYEKWLAPISAAQAAMSNQTFEGLTVWGAESKVPAGKLFLFTEHAAGQRAFARVQLGPYASPVPGAGLFANLAPTVREVQVNPGSDSEWLAGGDWVELLRRWGAFVSFERVVAGKVKTELTQALIDYPSFITFSGPKGIATAPAKGKLKNAAIVCTAPDCADASLEGKKGLKRVTASGRQLFTTFAKLGVDGIVLNPNGPGPTRALDEPFCWGVIHAIAERSKAPG